MTSKDELKEIGIKNRTCYYFDNKMTVSSVGFNDILLKKKSQKNTLIYDVSYKHFTGGKPLHIRFDKIDGFIKVYDRIRYLVIFDYQLYDEIHNRIRYPILEKSGITNSINHSFERIRTDSHNFLPTEKNTDFSQYYNTH